MREFKETPKVNYTKIIKDEVVSMFVTCIALTSIIGIVSLPFLSMYYMEAHTSSLEWLAHEIDNTEDKQVLALFDRYYTDGKITHWEMKWLDSEIANSKLRKK